MADNKEQLSDDLIKALKNVLSESEFTEFMKGQKPDEKEKKEEEEEENEEEVVEKAFKKSKEDYKAMKAALKAKKAELEKAFPDKFNDEDEEDEIGEKENKKPKEVEKSQTPDLVKAFGDALDIKLQAISKANTDLLNSFELIKSENSELKKAIEVIGNQRPGMKSMTRSSFIEKANENQFDEGGKIILSVTKNKQQVERVLDDAFEKAESSDIKNALGSCLANYNSGGSPIAEPIAQYLYKNHNTKLVQ